MRFKDVNIRKGMIYSFEITLNKYSHFEFFIKLTK